MKRPLVVEEERLNFTEQPEHTTGDSSISEQASGAPEEAIGEDSSSKQPEQNESSSEEV